MFMNMNFQNVFGMPGPQRFECRLRAYSAAYYPNFDNKKVMELNYGGKILLPNSVLDNLIRLHIEYPMMFKLTNPNTQRVTHSGVLEFVSEEGKCFLPGWMMHQLVLNEGAVIVIEYSALSKGSYAKFKPMSTDFLNVSNPRAMLEVELRKFACLTKNDIIAVQYNDTTFEFRVQELKPANAVSIIETDMNVEFDAPEGYVEPTYEKKTDKPPAPELVPIIPTGFQAFTGEGYRLDGKSKSASSSRSKLLDQFGGTSASTSQDKTNPPKLQLPPVVVDENYIPGNLTFVRYDYKSRVVQERELREKEKGGNEKLDLFSGSSYTIRGKR